jgi:hypothetical protein
MIITTHYHEPQFPIFLAYLAAVAVNVIVIEATTFALAVLLAWVLSCRRDSDRLRGGGAGRGRGRRRVVLGLSEVGEVFTWLHKHTHTHTYTDGGRARVDRQTRA